jgi:hypothetical protein
MIATRPDLSQRTALSKSALVAFDLCQTKAWLEITDRRPMLPNEKVSFGSALDAAIEIVIVGAREGFDALHTMTGVMEAIESIEVRDGMELPTEELLRAVSGFREEVLPKFDWTGAATQPDVWAEIPGLGDCNGHPDIVLANGNPWDVKSSSREKAIPSVELGLYAILMESFEGHPVTEAGYLTWVRSGKGHWSIQPMAITPEVRRWTWEIARRYVAAKELGSPAAFGGGPKFPGLCSDCSYAPWNEGPCQIAYRGGT